MALLEGSPRNTLPPAPRHVAKNMSKELKTCEKIFNKTFILPSFLKAFGSGEGLKLQRLPSIQHCSSADDSSEEDDPA